MQPISVLVLISSAHLVTGGLMEQMKKHKIDEDG
jgi:hypothetical protein